MIHSTFEQHPLHPNLQALKELVAKVAEEIPESTQLELVVRFDSVVQYIEDIVESINVTLLVQNTADAIGSNLAQLVSILTNYLTTRNDAHLVQAPPYLDAVIALSTQVVLEKKKGSRIIHISNDKLISAFEDSFKSLLASERDQLRSLTESVSSSKSEMSTLLLQIQAEKTRLDSAISGLQTQFTANEQSRATKADDSIAKFRLDTETRLKELETSVVKQLKDQDTLFLDHEKFLLAKKAEASKIVQIVSNIGFSGNYHNIAEKERWNSNWLRIVAITIMLVFSTFAVLTLLELQNPAITWQASLLKIFSISLLTVPFTYLSRESTKHRKLEQQYRRMELELSSIDAFIETLPEDRRYQLKTEITQRLFGSNLESNDKVEDDVISSNLLMKLLEEIRKIVK